MPLVPMNDRILVKPTESKDPMKGGIYIPDSAKEKPQEGEVIALGTGKTLDDGSKVDFQVKAGDKVLYSKYSGNEIKYSDDKFLIMREDDVLAIIR